MNKLNLQLNKRMRYCIMYTISFFLFTLLTSIQAFAQFLPPTTIRTPYGNVTTPGSYTPRVYSFDNAYSSKFTFFIVLKNDSTIVANSKIKFRSSDKPSEISWKENGRKYTVTPDQTKEIYRIDVKRNKIRGIPQDSCWLFLIDTAKVDKKIKLYSMTSDISSPTISHFKVDKMNDILPLQKSTLAPHAQENEKAKKLVSKNQLLKAIEELNR